MLAAIAVPYADTSAAELSWALGLDSLPAQAEIVVRQGALSVALKVLGASHQVELRRAGEDGTAAELVLTETVACLVGEPAGLPEVTTRPVPGGQYTFESAVLTYQPAQFAAVVADLRDRLEGEESSLVGVFGDQSEAVTALRAVPPTRDGGRDRGTGWRSWHAYPQTGEIVLTRSEVVPA